MYLRFGKYFLLSLLHLDSGVLMSQKKKRARTRSRGQQKSAPKAKLLPGEGVSWLEGGGVHAFLPGERPSQAQLQQMTEAYQRELRKSPLFKGWVKQYGNARAIEMLRECRVELR